MQLQIWPEGSAGSWSQERKWECITLQRPFSMSHWIAWEICLNVSKARESADNDQISGQLCSPNLKMIWPWLLFLCPLFPSFHYCFLPLLFPFISFICLIKFSVMCLICFSCLCSLTLSPLYHPFLSHFQCFCSARLHSLICTFSVSQHICLLCSLGFPLLEYI